MLALVITSAYALPGTVHVLYNNGQVVEDSVGTYFEFDIQAYVTEGTEILGAGMAYIEYPTSIFGDLAINNNIVTVTKTGILAGTIPDMEIFLYDIIENDTYSDVFAITFDTPFAQNSSLEPYFPLFSTDPLAPSDLLHVKMALSNYGEGTIVFPDYIPGIDNLYYNFYYEAFSAVDVSEATVAVNYTDPNPPAPDPVGSVEFKSLVASWKKNTIEVKWSTRNEVDLLGYVVKRSTNGGDPVEVASYLTDPSLVAQAGVSVLKYDFIDENVMASNVYSYLIEAVDLVGCTFPYGPVNVEEDVVILTEAYPNPFNPSFVVPFELYAAKDVNIKLYDMTGRVVRNIANGNHTAGRYEYLVNCDNLSSGVYLLRTVIDDNPTTQKMLLVK
jgi:hypothetical protein